MSERAASVEQPTTLEAKASTALHNLCQEYARVEDHDNLTVVKRSVYRLKVENPRCILPVSYVVLQQIDETRYPDPGADDHQYETMELVVHDVIKLCFTNKAGQIKVWSDPEFEDCVESDIDPETFLNVCSAVEAALPKVIHII